MHDLFTKWEKTFRDSDLQEFPPDNFDQLSHSAYDPLRLAKDAQHFVENLPPDEKSIYLEKTLEDIKQSYQPQFVNSHVHATLKKCYGNLSIYDDRGLTSLQEALYETSEVRVKGYLASFAIRSYAHPATDIRHPYLSFEMHDPAYSEDGGVDIDLPHGTAIPVSAIAWYMIDQRRKYAYSSAATDI